jgi:signal transduction histidine kinase
MHPKLKKNQRFLMLAIFIFCLVPNILCLGSVPEVAQAPNSDYATANAALFEKYSSDELKSQIEYEKLNSKRLEQELQQVKNQMSIDQDKVDDVHKLYLLILFVFCSLLIGVTQKWRKNVKLNFAAKLDTAQREFEKEIVRMKTRLTLETIEKERDRVARNLHDGISNNLVSLRLQLQAMNNTMQGKELLVRLAENTHKEVRAIMHNLSTPAVDNLKFEQLFYNHIEVMNYRETLKVEGVLLPESGWERINKQVQTELYRLLQEITGNILKHSGATSVNVTLRRDDGHIVLLAEDNGVGIVNENKSNGFGMKNLKMRVEQLNGQIQVDTVPLEGTVIRVQVPLSVV